MASIILSGLAATAGGFVGGAFGASAGRLLGTLAGSLIDNKLFARTTTSSSNGPRLKDLLIQSASYGHTIPIIFGTVRLGGNIIWARPYKETPSMQKYVGGAKGSKVVHTRTEYSYHASFALSICEGEIDEVIRIYAGQKQIQPSLYNIRIYHGSETQMPDPMIESFEGVGKTPAFRGQADEMEFYYHGNSQKAFSPVKLSISPKGEISWVRRNRMVTGLMDYTDIPGEIAHERYIVQLLDADNSLIETIQTSKPSFKIEQQCALIRICQLNNAGMEGFYVQLKLD